MKQLFLIYVLCIPSSSLAQSVPSIANLVKLMSIQQAKIQLLKQQYLEGEKLLHELEEEINRLKNGSPSPSRTDFNDLNSR